jgi:hypothetical protein
MMDRSGRRQVIMAKHSPVLMDYPNATLLRLTKYGLEPTTVEQTDHYKVLREFLRPHGFVEAEIADTRGSLGAHRNSRTSAREHRSATSPVPDLTRIASIKLNRQA